MSRLLVTGGAGYIGSHTVRRLMQAGHDVTILDNLYAGHREAVPEGAAFIEADLLDQRAVQDAVREARPDAAVHFAALIEVGESMRDPRRYWRNNFTGSMNFMDAVVDAGNVPVVFSSTAAVYGEPDIVPIPEHAPKRPTSVYGESKLMTERLLASYGNAYGLRHTNLRYFNVCGADESGSIGEDHPNKTHLIELALLTALGQRDSMKIFGTDYPTPDGTCIRDYIHVNDLADAHVLAIGALLDGAPSSAYNVGIGHGFSVKEVLDTVDAVVGKPLRREIEGRRPGDPAVLVADSTLIRRELGWTPRHTDLRGIIESAWRWHSSHPQGFATAT